MIIETLKGDLITMIDNTLAGLHPEFVMAQGCNCFQTQGSGIAGQLRKYPEVYEADLKAKYSTPYSKLGSMSTAELYGAKDTHHVTVLNMYTQFDFGTDKRHANYAAIAEAFVRLNLTYSQPWNNSMVYIPKIGSDLAGGDWNIIEQIINDATPDVEITLIDYTPGVDPREK